MLPRESSLLLVVFGLFPVTFSSFPVTFGSFPVTFGSFPLTFSPFPVTFGSFPLTFSSFPVTFGSFPLTFSSFPLTFSSFLVTFGLLLTNFGLDLTESGSFQATRVLASRVLDRGWRVRKSTFVIHNSLFGSRCCTNFKPWLALSGSGCRLAFACGRPGQRSRSLPFRPQELS